MIHSEALIWQYIEQNWVVSFTTNLKEELWSANAFYIFEKENHSLIILSSQTTKHGKMLLENPLVAGTISNQIADISQLKGIQFNGEMQILDTESSDIAFEKYCEKFPVAKTRKETVWRLTFTQIKYTDNSLGFGTKLYWNK